MRFLRPQRPARVETRTFEAKLSPASNRDIGVDSCAHHRGMTHWTLRRRCGWARWRGATRSMVVAMTSAASRGSTESGAHPGDAHPMLCG
jgi:hypothetical protein